MSISFLVFRFQDEEKEDDNDQDDDVTESGGIPSGTSGAADGTAVEDGEGMKEKTDKELEEEFAAWQACCDIYIYTYIYIVLR